MKTLASALALLVAIEHVWFMVLEMFLWTQPIGLKTFQLEPEFAQASASLAMNQGLYNGFLAAGLLWALLLIRDPTTAGSVRRFFLGCVVVAGVFGAVTVSPRIFFIQALPALLAMGAARLSRAR